MAVAPAIEDAEHHRGDVAPMGAVDEGGFLVGGRYSGHPVNPACFRDAF
jgi:hypothetical protein